MCAFVLDSNRRESVALGMRSDGDSRYLAFFDECGDHSMEKIDRDFPLFVLALVVMEREAYRDQALPEFNGFKLRYFSHEGINLHSRDIDWRPGRSRFYRIPSCVQSSWESWERLWNGCRSRCSSPASAKRNT